MENDFSVSDTGDTEIKTRRRGQAALEFLTTYGWVFIVILVVIGAFSYFGVLDPSKNLPDKCVMGSIFTCTNDYQINSATNMVTWIITQSSGKTIFIQNASVTTDNFGSSTQCSAKGTAFGAGVEVQMDYTEKINVSCTIAGGKQALSTYVGNRIPAKLTIKFRSLTSTYTKSENGDLYGTVQ